MKSYLFPEYYSLKKAALDIFFTLALIIFLCVVGYIRYYNDEAKWESYLVIFIEVVISPFIIIVIASIKKLLNIVEDSSDLNPANGISFLKIGVWIIYIVTSIALLTIL